MWMEAKKEVNQEKNMLNSLSKDIEETVKETFTYFESFKSKYCEKANKLQKQGEQISKFEENIHMKSD